MPSLTCYFVKTSLVYLALGLLFGLALALQDVFGLPVSLTGLFPVYLHLLVIGWLSQLIFGVAFWMFPKYSQERSRIRELKNPWGRFVPLLNVGLILRAMAEPWQSQNPEAVSAWLLVLSAVMQWLARLMFVFKFWGPMEEK